MFHKINLLKKEKYIFLFFLPTAIAVALLGEWLSFNSRGKESKDVPRTLKTKVYLSDLALFANRKLANSFYKKISIKLDYKPTSLVYGNSTVGYYETKDFEYSNKQLVANILPPGFGKTINFFIDKKIVYSKKFSPNKSNILKNIKIQKKGEMSNNLFLLGAVFFPNKLQSKKRGYFIFVLNRVGEIIWAHIPKRGAQNIRKYPVVKKIDKDKFAVLFGEKWSYFEIFDSKGNITFELEPKNLIDPYVIHHDFIFDKEKKTIKTFGHKLFYINNYFLKTPWKKTLDVLKPPLSIISTPIIEVNLKSKKMTNLFSPYQKLKPLEGSKILYNKEFYDYIQDSEPRHFSMWGAPEAKIDWLHANSIEKTSEGYLCSFRNINKVIMFSKDFKQILWTLGQDPTDTYYIRDPQKQFFHQHHVTMLEDGRIMMLDNHTGPESKSRRGTRAVIYELDPIIGTAHISWEYTATHFLKIGNRGSVEQLDNNNILAFYPRSLLEKDHLIEVDYETKRPKGHFAIYFATFKKKITENQIKWLKKNNKRIDLTPITRGGGNRAVPIKSIGKEEFIGYEY